MATLENNQGILLFDGVCNFCNSIVMLILKMDKKEKICFASFQSHAGKEILKKHQIPILEEPESVVFFKNGKVYWKSSAIIEVLRSVGGIYSVIVILKIFPKFLRDKIYDFIAKNRYKWFGKNESCMIPGPKVRNRFLD